MNRIGIAFGSVTVAAILAVLPLVAFADSDASKGVVISASGNVNVVGASVTSVGANSVNAAATLGSTTVSWTVNTSATTRIEANGSGNASTTDIAVGDTINFSGSLSGFGSSITVAASNIRDVTSFHKMNGVAGKVLSINVANGSFVLSVGNHTITVQINASTTIALHIATSTLAYLHVGENVKVTGTLNVDGTVITATKVIVNGNNEKFEHFNNKLEHVKDNVEREKDKLEREREHSARFFQSIFSHFHSNRSN